MTRLDSFRSDVKDQAAINAILTAKGIKLEEEKETIPMSALTSTVETQSDTVVTELTLREQTLRWYNANPAMFYVAYENLKRILEAKGAEGVYWEFVNGYHAHPESLTKHVENKKVFDITLFEDFMFSAYPGLDRIRTIIMKGQNSQQKHLIPLDKIETLNIFNLSNALVELSRTKNSPCGRIEYVDMLNLLTC